MQGRTYGLYYILKIREVKSMLFTLKNKDIPLLTFDLDGDSLRGYSLDIKSIYTTQQNIYPFGLDIENRAILRWIQNRNIPKNREFVNEILQSLSLKPDDIIGFLLVGKSLSLNDPFWIVENDFNGKFADYNLYENDFNAAVGLIAYTGHGQNNTIGTIPELTTNGTLRKAWRNRPDGIYLYKGGLHGFSNMGNEPYSEFYASQVGQAMSLNIIPYDLDMWEKELASTCKLFTSINTSFVPMHACIKGDFSLMKCANFFKNINEKAYDDFCNMIVFDALIYNTDRHTNNFGVLRDNATGKLEGMAPLFDHGYSIFDENREKYLKDLDSLKKYGQSLLPALGSSFEEEVKLFLGSKQRQMLRKLVGFKFRRHPLYNLPDQQIKLFEEFIQERTHELLTIDEKSRNLIQDKTHYTMEKEFADLTSVEKRKALQEIRFDFNDIINLSLIDRNIGDIVSCYHYVPNYENNNLIGISLIQIKEFPKFILDNLKKHTITSQFHSKIEEAKQKGKELKKDKYKDTKERILIKE